MCSCKNLQLDRPMISQSVRKNGCPWSSICLSPINDSVAGGLISNGVVMDVGDGTRTFLLER